MEKKNIFLGKIHKNGCYVNDGKYGYFLTCDKKNYKIPEWFPHESMTLEIAERLIQYKNKMSQLWLEKGNKNEKSELSVEEESDDEVDINKLLKIKK
jgi:topoisomerase IA-like protein